MIHLDGTFLKGRMKGQLLTALGIDPNDAMYIIAWAVVPVENKVYLGWFPVEKQKLLLQLTSVSSEWYGAMKNS